MIVIGAGACSHGEEITYEVGDIWSPDPCTTCHCVQKGNFAHGHVVLVFDSLIILGLKKMFSHFLELRLAPVATENTV